MGWKKYLKEPDCQLLWTSMAGKLDEVVDGLI
jgi:hypothetical protein